MSRKIYLQDIPLDEALSRFDEALRLHGMWDSLGAESVEISQALGRVTAGAVWANLSSPHYHASAMDGYAIRSKDSEGATETTPISLTLIASQREIQKVKRPAQPVNTGQPLPPWADCVVMVEHTQPGVDANGKPAIQLYASLPPWRHIRQMGEDMVATELVLPANHKLRPVDIGALAAAGHMEVKVHRKPVVAVIPTGSELVSIDSLNEGPPLPGNIIEFNSIVLSSQVESWGGRAIRWPIVPDDFGKVRAALIEAASKSDLVLVNAGSSAGSEDHTAQVVESAGKLLVHGVAVRPGHPVILGVIDVVDSEGNRSANEFGSEAVPIIGVPGYPVSAALTGEIFVEPLLARWQGLLPFSAPKIKAQLTRKIASHTGDEDFVRVSVGRVNERILATPLSRGAGVISSLVRADGLIRIPRFSEGLEAGASVDVLLYRSPEEIENTIVAIGSHDLTIDLMAQFLAQGSEGLRLTSANVGSLGGLAALRRQETHLAGCHLLDRESGTYNDSYVRRYLPNQDMVVVTLAGREQGWIVPKGNPLGIIDWQDAANPDVTIVNRQRGAGTRELLDYELEKAGIKPEDIRGYTREGYTHLAVAAAVASGTASAGLGIRAAARALDLGFISLAFELYELIIPRDHYESNLLQPLLALLNNQDFRDAVQSMPGYDIGPMGETRFISRTGI